MGATPILVGVLGLLTAVASLVARRSNQSILKEINPEYSLGGLMPKLKLQNFGHLMQRTDSFEKTLMLGVASIRQMIGQVWRGSAGEYQADEWAGVARLSRRVSGT